MTANVAAVLVGIILIVELYLSSAGSTHMKKRYIKGWNKAVGKIVSIDEKKDGIPDAASKKYMELKILVGDDRFVYAKQSPMFCIYEVDEEVELMEKDGVYRFVGNDRVHSRGKVETLLGVVPIVVIIAAAALMSVLAGA